MSLSQKTLDFLTENRFEDNREWFKAHKKDYETWVLAPLVELVERLTPTMRELDPLLITEARVDRVISRIYRDTRFSKDKFLYRDVVWCVFAREKKLYFGPPGFVLEFSPRSFRYGCGYFQASPKHMETMRELILRNTPSFQAARAAMENQTLFAMEGESYKRNRHPDQPPELQTWLNRKNLFFMRNSTDFDLLFSPDLHVTLAESFRALKPAYDFLAEVDERTPRE